MATPTRPIGVSGVQAPSGWYQTRDRNPDARWPYGVGTASSVGEYLHAAATEPALASCIAAVVLPISRGEWTIGAEEDEDPAVVDFLEEELLERRSPDFRDLLRDIVRQTIVAGFHVVEPVFRRRADGRIGLRDLAPRPAWTIERFLFDSATCDLEAIEQSAPDPSGRYVRVRLEARDVLIFSHEREGKDPTGRSMIRPALRDVKIKDFLKRLISVRNEREALGVPIGTYPAGATDAEKDAFEGFLQQYRAHERAYLMMPAGFDVRIPEGKVGSSDALRADAAYLTVEIQSAFLQAWQSLGREGSSSGGRAVGEVQADPYYLGLEAIMAEAAAPFDGLIAKLVDLNFGSRDGRPYPYLQPPKLRADDVMAAVLPILESIKVGGITPTPDVENDLRGRAGLEPREVDPASAAAPTAMNGAQVTALQGIATAVAAGELAVESAVALIVASFPVTEEVARRIAGGGKIVDDTQPAPPTQPQSPAPPSPTPTPDGPTDPEAEEVEDDEHATMRATDRGAVSLMWRPSRMLRPSEQRVAFGEMVARLDAAPADLSLAVGNIILRSRAAILRWIRPFARKMANGDRSGFEALAKADLPKSIRAALVEAVTTYAADMHAFGRAQAERERRKNPAAAEKQARREQQAIRDAALAPEVEAETFADPPADGALPPSTAAEAGVFGDRIADELLRIARLAATRAAANGGRLAPGTIPLVDVIEEAVDQALTTAAAGSATTKEAAVAVSVKALQGGRDEVFREDADLIASVEYSAAMDPQTCTECESWDGRTAASLEEADAILPGVPNLDCAGTAARCRCIWIVNYD